MKIKKYFYESLLLCTSLFWGLTFSFQKLASLVLPAFQFNAIRFFAGAISMLIISYFTKQLSTIIHKPTILQGFVLGIFLFFGNAFQQIGISHTTVTNTAFITTLYVLLIPVYMRFKGIKLTPSNWLATLIATIGLYLLSGANPAQTQYGDILQLIGAIFWAAHIIFLGSTKKILSAISLNFWQILFCGILSLITSKIIREDWIFLDIYTSWHNILITGVLSMGIGLLLQVIAQKHVKPNNAAIILSLEGLFAVFFSWLIINELVTIRIIIGGLLITFAVIYSQIKSKNIIN